MAHFVTFTIDNKDSAINLDTIVLIGPNGDDWEITYVNGKTEKVSQDVYSAIMKEISPFA